MQPNEHYYVLASGCRVNFVLLSLHVLVLVPSNQALWSPDVEKRELVALTSCIPVTTEIYIGLISARQESCRADNGPI